MLVANDEYSDGCTDTADIGSYDITYRRANSCTQPVSDEPAHSSAYDSQIRSRAAVSVQAVERKHHDRLLELGEQLDQGNAFVELDSHHHRSE